jgi:uncharacterized phage-associated protein
MNYSAKAIANYLIDVAYDDRKRRLSPMNLQKLVYFAHGWYLALYDKPLLDEKIEAWPYGPVVPSLYHEFKSFGCKNIRQHATDVCLDDDFEIVTPKIQNNKPLKSFLDKIWEVYGDYSAIQLSNMTHEDGTPWAITWGQLGVPKNTDIDDNVIKDYFVRLSEDDDNE